MTEQHAEFEALSAYVDGEAPEWADHVEACAECRATAAQLRAVANAVGKPVGSPSESGREAAIAAAVESFPATEAPVVVPLDEARRARLAPERPASGRPRTSRPWALPAVAAVIVAVLGFSGLVVSSYRSSDDETTTLAGPGLQSDKAESAVAANAPSVPASDLGDVPDAATLIARTRQLGLPGAPAPATARSGGASDATSGTAAFAVPPTTTLNQRAAPSVVGTRPCEDQARSRDPGLGPVVYFATARQGPVPAFVLGFGPVPGNPVPAVTLLMLAQDGCRELLRTTGP